MNDRRIDPSGSGSARKRRGLGARALLLAALVLPPVMAADRDAVAGEPETSAAACGAPGGAAARRSAYAPVEQERGVWQADNQAQRMRISFSAEGVRLTPPGPGRPAWEWGLSLSRYGAAGDERAAGYPFPRVAAGRMELLWGGATEGFRNGPKGLQHDLALSPAVGPGVLFLDFRLAGTLTPKVATDGRSIAFRDRSGAAVLAYRDLRALDADGREVTARWERREGRRSAGGDLRLVVYGGDHTFPLRITGLLATAKGVDGGAAQAEAAMAAALAIPTNDLCAGAEPVPGAGPFPWLSSVVNITDATTSGDPASPSCQPDVSRSVWFVFTPVSSAEYTFSLCSGAPTATTVDDTVLAVYSASGVCSGLSEVAGGCDDDSCSAGVRQSVVSHLPLSAGSTYYVVAWKYQADPPAAGAADLQLQVVKHAPIGATPANDLCGDAEIIPAAGPFPYLTTVTPDISGATTDGDPPAPSCQLNVSRSIWYTFTPASSGRYIFSLCAGDGTATTADDTVLAIYTAAAACSGFTEMPGGCDDDSCLNEAAQSLIDGVDLSAGTPYYIVVWQYGTLAPTIGNTAVQMRVSRLTAPPNDTCPNASVLALDSPAAGTTVGAHDDTRLPAGAACFTGIGQTVSTAPGLDVVYRFTAPGQDRYSFRLGGVDPSRNAVLYLASDCPAGAPPAVIGGCLGAANRNPSGAEEVMCLPLAAGQTVYLYADEHTASSGGPLTVEVNRCRTEVEPNETPPAAGEMVCGLEGSITPAGDRDFFAIGLAAAGSRLFAMADGAAAGTTDFDLRATTAADTLEYDDLNNDVPFGVVAPNASGTPLGGAVSYLRVNHYNSGTRAEPYRLYAAIQPDAASATPEVEPNDDIATATGGANEYYAGALSGTGDVDYFSFTAAAGDLVQVGLDLDPLRNNTPFGGSLELLDASGASLMRVDDTSFTSNPTPGTGSLTANSPGSPGEALVHRVRSGGTHYLKVAWSAGSPGDYLLSVAHDCRVAPPTDIAVTQTDAPDPAPPGGEVAYTITVSVPGPRPATVVTLRDDLPAGSVFVSATPTQGLCAGSGPVVCHLGTLASGAAAGVSIVVTAPGGAGPITNVASVSTAVIDTNRANDTAGEGTMVGSTADSDGDGVPDGEDCAPADGAVWAAPGPATGLLFPGAVDPTLLQWSPPALPGADVLRYDLLRSGTPIDFSHPVCVASDVSVLSAFDPEMPGTVFYFLVRSKNACGMNVGTQSDGTPRVAGSCP